ncbi:MAG: FAD-dependent monooxygenase, partial [Sphingomicrobium sp.]
MQQTDVIILGGGLVGLALAAALDASGLSSTVVDPADPDLRLDAAFDGRTSAVSSSSARMFDTIGVTPHFPVPGGPIRRIRTSDGLAPGSLTFDAGEEGEQLGQMHENRHLRAALRARAEAGKSITLRYKNSATTVDRGEHGVTVTLDSGETLRAPLLVSAEGRNSATREAARIRIARWSYKHRAIVSTLRH